MLFLSIFLRILILCSHWVYWSLGPTLLLSTCPFLLAPRLMPSLMSYLSLMLNYLLSLLAYHSCKYITVCHSPYIACLSSLSDVEPCVYTLASFNTFMYTYHVYNTSLAIVFFTYLFILLYHSSPCNTCFSPTWMVSIRPFLNFLCSPIQSHISRQWVNQFYFYLRIRILRSNSP